MSNVYFVYNRSQALRQRVLMETGKLADQRAEVEIDLANLDPAVRKRLVTLLGLPEHVNVNMKYVDGYVLYNRSEPGIEYNLNKEPHLYVRKSGASELMVLDEDLPAALTAALDRCEQEGRILAPLRERYAAEHAAWQQATREQDLAERDAAYAKAEAMDDDSFVHDVYRLPEGKTDEQKARYAALQQRTKDIREARETARKAEIARKEAERREWIEAHGSDFLRKAVGAGYDCQRRYVTERVAIEHPGAVVDFEEHADWRDRSCPSEAALDKALAVEGEVVWLTDYPLARKLGEHEYDDYEDFEACEAVIVHDYLGKYRVVYTSGF